MNTFPPDDPYQFWTNDIIDENEDGAAMFGDSPAPSSELSPTAETFGDFSMAEDTTNTAPAATLTEKELWAQFLDTDIKTSIKVGSATLKGEIDPYGCLTTSGAYGWIGDFTEYVADQLSKTDSPAEELDTLIDDLEGYVFELKFIRDKFKEVKEAAIIMPEEPDEEACTQEEFSAWEDAAIAAEKNPRYRAIAEDEREVA